MASAISLSSRVGSVQRSQITRDAGIDLFHPPGDLGNRVVLVAIVHRFELAAVDRNRQFKQHGCHFRTVAALLLTICLAGCVEARDAAVQIALREWRAFGQKIVLSPDTPEDPDSKERDEGLWQRVGDYLWGDSPPMIKHFGGAVTLPGVSVEGVPAY